MTQNNSVYIFSLHESEYIRTQSTHKFETRCHEFCAQIHRLFHAKHSKNRPHITTELGKYKLRL